MTATMTSSKYRAVRSMMSRCPLVTGSNEPGMRAIAKGGLSPVSRRAEPSSQPYRRSASVDERPLRCPPRQRLDAERPTAGEQVEDVGVVDHAHALQRREDRRTDLVGRRTGLLALGCLQTQPAGGAGHHSHDWNVSSPPWA